MFMFQAGKMSAILLIIICLLPSTLVFNIFQHETLRLSSICFVTSAAFLPRIIFGKRVESNNSSSANEAIEILQRMFIDRSMLNSSQWDYLRSQLRMTSDPLEALEELRKRLNDPYMRILPQAKLSIEQRKIRGVNIGVGLKLRRCATLKHAMLGFRNLFFPYKCGIKATYGSDQPHKASIVVDRIARQAGHTLSNLLAMLTLLNPLVQGCSLSDSFCGSVAGMAYLTYQLLPFLYPLKVVAIENGASHSSIFPGDTLLGINGRHAPLLPASFVERWLNRGEVGDNVTLHILPGNIPAFRTQQHHQQQKVKSNFYNLFLAADSTHIFDTTVIRRYFDSSSVQYSLLPAKQGDALGYMKISDFSELSCFESSQAMHCMGQELQQQRNCSLKGLVIDLRDNPGGSVISALQIASLFLPYNAVLMQMKVNNQIKFIRNDQHLPNLGRQGVLLSHINPVTLLKHLANLCNAVHFNDNTQRFKQLQLLLLVNQNTASASEILVEALIDNHKNTQTMGARTVGKNKAQAIMQLSDGTGLCFSISGYALMRDVYRSMKEGHLPHIQLHDADIEIERVRFNSSARRWTLL